MRASRRSSSRPALSRTLGGEASGVNGEVLGGGDEASLSDGLHGQADFGALALGEAAHHSVSGVCGSHGGPCKAPLYNMLAQRFWTLSGLNA